ncbi:unnamed protein product [Linum trigynum]|uniref:Uncharacterized protein n=1 Tax=Linum trigynum TaxID=586398 RepID=A0AAV2F4D1_9ROSI
MALDHTRPGPCWLRGHNWDGVFDLADHTLESFALRRRDDIYRDTFPSFWFLPVTWDISKLHDKHHMEEKKAWKRERLLPGSECWKLPKRAVRNPKHPAHHNNITRTNRFRALLSDDDEDVSTTVEQEGFDQ